MNRSEPVPEGSGGNDDGQGGSGGFLGWFRRDEGETRQASFLERYGGVVLLALMIVIFTITLPGKFLTYDNLIGIVGNQTIGGIVALGLLLPLAAGVFDISIGGVMTVAIVLVTWLFQTTGGDIPIPAAILITLIAGLCAGVINGLLVVKAKVDPFIATIGTSSVFVGISQLIANGETIARDIPSAFTSIGRTEIFDVPLTTVYLIVLAIGVWYLLDHTPFGRKVYATGAGREAARLSGVPTNRIIFTTFLISALFATIAAVVYAARLGSGPPNTGASYLLPAYASAFLGSTMIKPGRFNVPGLIVALFIVAVGINGLQLYGIPFWVVETYQGLALIVAVVLARSTSNKSNRRAKQKQQQAGATA
ncbi:MAG: ABC transporter permease [Solirubrobacterales bacterium]|nr:ABC transporter permease [Solirubrobacterales bacterium]